MCSYYFIYIIIIYFYIYLATASHNFELLKITHLFNLRTNICKSWCLDTHFIPNNSDLVDK